MLECAVPGVCMILDLVFPGSIWFWWNAGSGIGCTPLVLIGGVFARLYMAA
jgi:hypothetical protein